MMKRGINGHSSASISPLKRFEAGQSGLYSGDRDQRNGWSLSFGARCERIAMPTPSGLWGRGVQNFMAPVDRAMARATRIFHTFLCFFEDANE